jgi:hypothetical protein
MLLSLVSLASFTGTYQRLNPLGKKLILAVLAVNLSNQRFTATAPLIITRTQEKCFLLLLLNLRQPFSLEELEEHGLAYFWLYLSLIVISGKVLFNLDIILDQNASLTRQIFVHF